MASIREVAKLAGVSPATVSRVINGTANVDDEKKQRVLKVINETGFRPNELARALFKQSSKIIGVIVPNIENPFFSELAKAIEEEAYENGYKMLLCNSNNNEEKELLETIQNKKHIIIVNKTDLETKIDLKDENYIRMSTINNIGIKELKERIIKLFELDKIEQSDMTYLTNARSIALLKQVKEKIEEIENSINMNIPISIIEIDLRNVWEILGKIIGEHYEDELIDQLFTQFCLGK